MRAPNFNLFSCGSKPLLLYFFGFLIFVNKRDSNSLCDEIVAFLWHFVLCFYSALVHSIAELLLRSGTPRKFREKG